MTVEMALQIYTELLGKLENGETLTASNIKTMKILLRHTINHLMRHPKDVEFDMDASKSKAHSAMSSVKTNRW